MFHIRMDWGALSKINELISWPAGTPQPTLPQTRRVINTRYSPDKSQSISKTNLFLSPDKSQSQFSQTNVFLSHDKSCFISLDNSLFISLQITIYFHDKPLFISLQITIYFQDNIFLSPGYHNSFLRQIFCYILTNHSIFLKQISFIS